MQDAQPQFHGTLALDALSALHQRNLDALAGYETMLEKAEPGFRPVVERYRDLHARHVAELATIMIRSGLQPDDSASVMGVINKVVVTLRSAFDSIDSDVLRQIHSGEGHVLEAYDELFRVALVHDGLSAPDLDRIEVMRSELTALLAATRPPAG